MGVDPPRRHAAIAGLGMAVPERRVSNSELASMLAVDEDWITKRTGTAERRWAVDGERMSDYAARAAADALSRAGVNADDLDLVVVATSTADEITPNAAPVVAGLLGAHRAGCFDVGAACTGWLAGLAIATGQIEAGRAHHAVVIGADFLSQFLDLNDRGTAVLFADGAGAAVVVSTEASADLPAGTGPAGQIGPIVLRSDASGAGLIRLERSGPIQMQGQETFRAAVKALSEVTEEALAAARTSLEDIDLFVYHQANSRIIRAVGERLGLDRERVVDYVARYANASTATLPIALSVAEREGRLRPRQRVLLAAFGGGFTWGAGVVTWGDPKQSWPGPGGPRRGGPQPSSHGGA